MYSHSFLLFLVLITIPLGIMTNNGGDTYQIIIPAIICMQFYLIRKLQNVQPLLLLSIYIFYYFIYFIPYFYQGLVLSQWLEFQKKLYFSITLYQFYLFYLGMSLGASYSINPNRNKLIDFLRFKTTPLNSFIYIILLCAIISLVFKIGENVLNTDNPYEAYMDNLNESSSLPLFATLFLFLSYLIIPNKTTRTILLLLFSCILLYHNITRGFRIIIPTLFLLIFLVYFDLKWKTRTIILLFFIGFCGLIFLNNLKNGDSFSFATLFTEPGNDFILSHHADSLYASACMNGLVEQNQISFIDRFLLTCGFFLESIIPPSFLPLSMKYPLFISNYTMTGGGGLCITGCYLMGGNFFTIVFPFLLTRFIAFCYSGNANKYICLIGAVIIILFPRWASYDFHVILRLPILACLIMWGLYKIKSEPLFCR